MNRSIALIAGLVALAGCPDATKSESGDSSPTPTTTCDPVTGDTLIYEVAVTCDGDDNVTFWASTTGWVQQGGDNSVYAIDSANNQSWSESHPIDTNLNRDACGAYDEIELTIPTQAYGGGATTGAYVPGVESFFTCDAHYNDPAVMNYAFAIVDINGAYADCFAFGHDPAGLVAGDYSGAGATPDMDLSLCTPDVAR
jgi:hypothetical protein